MGEERKVDEIMDKKSSQRVLNIGHFAFREMKKRIADVIGS